jgi:streptogramin lyase
LWLLTTTPARILQLDEDTGQVTRAIDLRPPFARRPSSADTRWVAHGSGALWATLPSYDAVARVDTTTGTVRYFDVPYGAPSGIAVGGGFAWVATDHAVLQLDEKTGNLRAAAIVPSALRSGPMSISFGNAAVWLANYDRGTLTRFRYVR